MPRSGCQRPVPDGRPPPYICAGLHVVGSEDDSVHGSFTVTKMEPGRCPIAVVNDPRSTTTENSKPTQGAGSHQPRPLEGEI
jgi:hypothetical protein